MIMVMLIVSVTKSRRNVRGINNFHKISNTTFMNAMLTHRHGMKYLMNHQMHLHQEITESKIGSYMNKGSRFYKADGGGIRKHTDAERQPKDLWAACEQKVELMMQRIQCITVFNVINVTT